MQEQSVFYTLRPVIAHVLCTVFLDITFRPIF